MQASLPVAMAGETCSPMRPARQGGGGRLESGGAEVTGWHAEGSRRARAEATARWAGEVGQHVIAEALYPSGNGVNGRLLNFYRVFFRSRCSTLSCIRVLKERIAAPVRAASTWC